MLDDIMLDGSHLDLQLLVTEGRRLRQGSITRAMLRHLEASESQRHLCRYKCWLLWALRIFL